MREQRQESEWILSCQMSLMLKCGCTKDPSPFLYAIVIDAARGTALSKLLCADDLVLMSETIEVLVNKFL